jgi:hypothetical protein
MGRSEQDIMRKLEDVAGTQLKTFLDRNKHTVLDALVSPEKQHLAEGITYEHHSLILCSDTEAMPYSIGVLCRDADQNIFFGNQERFVRDAFSALYMTDLNGNAYVLSRDDSGLLIATLNEVGLSLPASNDNTLFKRLVAVEAKTPVQSEGPSSERQEICYN